jgi:hypothetical protein
MMLVKYVVFGIFFPKTLPQLGLLPILKKIIEQGRNLGIQCHLGYISHCGYGLHLTPYLHY